MWENRQASCGFDNLKVESCTLVLNIDDKRLNSKYISKEQILIFLFFYFYFGSVIIKTKRKKKQIFVSGCEETGVGLR